MCRNIVIKFLPWTYPHRKNSALKDAQCNAKQGRGGAGERGSKYATTTFQKRNKSETGTINGEWTGLGWGAGTYSFVHSTPHFLFPTPETQVTICCQTSEQSVCSYKQSLCQGVNEKKKKKRKKKRKEKKSSSHQFSNLFLSLRLLAFFVHSVLPVVLFLANPSSLKKKKKKKNKKKNKQKNKKNKKKEEEEKTKKKKERKKERKDPSHPQKQQQTPTKNPTTNKTKQKREK